MKSNFILDSSLAFNLVYAMWNSELLEGNHSELMKETLELLIIVLIVFPIAHN